MTRLWLTAICSFALLTCGCASPESRFDAEAQPGAAAGGGSFEEQVAEYIKEFPYQLTYDYMIRFTGGDPAKLNTWVPRGRTRSGEGGRRHPAAHEQ